MEKGQKEFRKREVQEGNIGKAVRDMTLQQKPLNLGNLEKFNISNRFNRENVIFTDHILKKRLKTSSLVTTSYVGSLIQALKKSVLGESDHIIKDLHKLNGTMLKNQEGILDMELGHEEFLLTYALLGLLAIMILVQFFLLHIFKTSVQNNITKVLTKYSMQY